MHHNKVHDTLTIIKKQDKNSFLEHLNSINPSIKFSITDGTMPFLGILITCKRDGTLKTSVIRKPTYTDLITVGQPTHNSIKIRCSGTLYHRAKTICSSQDVLHGQQHLPQKIHISYLGVGSMHTGGCYGVTHQSHSSQPIYGRPRSPSHQDITYHQCFGKDMSMTHSQSSRNKTRAASWWNHAILRYPDNTQIVP